MAWSLARADGESLRSPIDFSFASNFYGFLLTLARWIFRTLLRTTAIPTQARVYRAVLTAGFTAASIEMGVSFFTVELEGTTKRSSALGTAKECPEYLTN